MRLVLLLWVASCGVEPTPAPEVAAPVPEVTAPVSAEIQVRGDPPSGRAVLYWPSLPAAVPIAVTSEPDAPDLPWTDPVPADARSVGVRIAPGDLAQLRERVAAAGAPMVAPPSLVEIEARSFPGLPLGRLQLSWDVSDMQMRGTSATHVLVVRLGSDRATLAVEPGMERTFDAIEGATITPRDQDLTQGFVALDAVVEPGLAIGTPVRLKWPSGTELGEDLEEAGFLYLGPDERGWSKIGTLRYEKHLVSLRAEVGEPPVLVPDDRVALVVPLRTTPDPSRMSQTTHLTDGRRRSTDHPYAAVGDRSITVVVPADDVEWLTYWIRVSGGRLRLAGIRQIDRSGFDPPPPGFPPSTRLRL